MSSPDGNWQSYDGLTRLAGGLSNNQPAQEGAAVPPVTDPLTANRFAILRERNGSETNDSADEEDNDVEVVHSDHGSLGARSPNPLESQPRPRRPSWDSYPADGEDDLSQLAGSLQQPSRSSEPSGAAADAEATEATNGEAMDVDPPKTGESSDTTLKLDSPAFVKWKQDGRPQCATCGRSHPPPCDPAKAKKAIAEDALKEHFPEEYKKLQQKKNSERRRATKLRKRADQQNNTGAQASSSQTQQAVASSSRQPTKTTNSQQANSGRSNAQTPSGARPNGGHTSRERGLAYCRRCACSHPWGAHTQAPSRAATNFPSLPAQTAATTANVSASTNAPPQRGNALPVAEVMAHLMQNVRTQNGLDYLVAQANRGPGAVNLQGSQPSTYAGAAATSASTNAGNQQNQRTNNSTRGGGNANHNRGGAQNLVIRTSGIDTTNTNRRVAGAAPRNTNASQGSGTGNNATAAGATAASTTGANTAAPTNSTTPAAANAGASTGSSTGNANASSGSTTMSAKAAGKQPASK